MWRFYYCLLHENISIFKFISGNMKTTVFSLLEEHEKFLKISATAIKTKEITQNFVEKGNSVIEIFMFLK